MTLNLSTRDGIPMQSEKMVLNDAPDETNVNSVDEKRLQNDQDNFTLEERFRTDPRIDEYDVDFSYVALR
jgi:hypothetical protein